MQKRLKNTDVENLVAARSIAALITFSNATRAVSRRAIQKAIFRPARGTQQNMTASVCRWSGRLVTDLCIPCESMLEVNLDGPDVTVVWNDVLCVRLQEPESENKRPVSIGLRLVTLYKTELRVRCSSKHPRLSLETFQPLLQIGSQSRNSTTTNWFPDGIESGPPGWKPGI